MKKIILFILLILLISCSKSDQIKKFTDRFEQKINLRSMTLAHDKNLLGNPTDIKIIDSMLLFLDPDGQYHIKAVNIHHPDRSYPFLVKGRGPNEFGSIRSINVNQRNEVCFFDDNTLTYYEIPFKIDDKVIVPSAQKKLSLDFGRVIFTAGLNGINISTGVFKKDGRFLLSDESKEDRGTLIGEYPLDQFPGSSNLVKGMAYQTFMRIGRNDHLMVAYCFRAGCITFFNFTNKKITIRNNYSFYLPDYSPDADQGLGVKYNPESFICFLDVCIVGDNVFALFSGRSVRDYKTNAYLGNRLFVFSKKGLPQAEITLDRDIRCFDIDAQTATIYGVTLTPFPEIVKFSLNGKLMFK